MEADLLVPQFTDPDKAREFLEAQRWPDGAVCPHCGVIGDAYRLEPKEGAKTHARNGTWKCGACREQFSVTVDSIFEDSHIPLNKWLLAIHLLCSSKKGMSAHQLHRMLGITYKSAWFMAHRLRYAMGQEPLVSKLQGTVEMDETYIGGKLRLGRGRHFRGQKGPNQALNPRANKTAVVAILERDGRVKSMPVERVTNETLKPILEEMVDKSAHVMTDSSTALRSLPKDGWKHSQVNHSKGEYVRYEGEETVTTNAVESFFAILKRGNYGVYHHWGRHYMQQYLNEYDFRHNTRRITDGERAQLALKATEGKRLMLKEPKALSHS